MDSTIGSHDLVIRRLKWIFKLLDRSGTNTLQVVSISRKVHFVKLKVKLGEIIQTFSELYMLEGLDTRYSWKKPIISSRPISATMLHKNETFY